MLAINDWDNDQWYEFRDNISIDDIVFVRDGNTPIALVAVKSDCYQSDSLAAKYKFSCFAMGGRLFTKTSRRLLKVLEDA